MYDPWDKIEKKDGKINIDHTWPTILTQQEFNNFVDYATANAIYSTYGGDRKKVKAYVGDVGAQALGTKVKSAENRDIETFNLPGDDENTITQDDIYLIRQPNDASMTNNNFWHFRNCRAGTVDSYLTGEARENALREINEYNASVERIDAAKQEEENVKAAQENRKPQTLTNTTPVCNDLKSNKTESSNTQTEGAK